MSMELIVDILFLGVFGWSCYNLGKISAARDLARMIADGRLKTALEQLTEEQTKPNEEPMNLELHPEGIFAYGREGRFLAHATEWRSLFEKVKQLHPNSNFRVQLAGLGLDDRERADIIKIIFDVFGDQDNDHTR